MFNPAYAGVALLGLLHGMEPGHGWPIALVYSARKSNPLLSGFVSASIIAFAHFVSSVAVVLAYILLKTWLNFDSPIIKYLAAALLLILAFRLFKEKSDGLEKQHGHIHENQPEVEHEHEHEHPDIGRHGHWHKHSLGTVLSLWGITTFAFILGFAHEEEFTLLALVAGGVSAFTLMLSYALSVALGLIGVTLISVRIYKQIQPKLIRYERFIPKISAAILVLMAIIIVV